MVPRRSGPRVATAEPNRPASRILVFLAGTMGMLQLLNFLNYSDLRHLVDFALIRAGLLSTLTAVLLLAGARHFFTYHLTKQWDIYAFCVICLATTAISPEPDETLKYSVWLLLSCYAALEIGRRVESLKELQLVLLIVLVPSALASFAVYTTFGPTVISTGRVFGGLGTAHVDVAIMLGFSLLLLAIYSLKGKGLTIPRTLRWLALPLIGYAAYLIVFGLTRSVWLSFTLGLLLYLGTNIKRAAIAGLAVVVATLVLDVVGLAPIGLVPDAVKGRVELTQKRTQAGEIDPRLRGMRSALEIAARHPEGTGYAVMKTHNSYFDVLVGTGITGFALMILVVLRSAWLCGRMPGPYFRFFLIGSAGLLTHAFFETQATPGQANFIPLVAWLAMTRSAFVMRTGAKLAAKPSEKAISTIAAPVSAQSAGS